MPGAGRSAISQGPKVVNLGRYVRGTDQCVFTCQTQELRIHSLIYFRVPGTRYLRTEVSISAAAPNLEPQSVLKV